MNSPLGKRILAMVRESDYAHPGEEEAIRMTLESLVEKSRRRWLDAGCGRGGTADFIMRQGWADVSAFDIDAVTLEESRKVFSTIPFYTCGVVESPSVIHEKFNLIYSMNAVYAFPDLAKSLQALRALAEDSAKLVIFDYVDRGGFYDSPFTRLPEVAHWHPLEESSLADKMADAGWHLGKMQNLDAEYERWYAVLVARFDARRALLTEIASSEIIDYARNIYAQLLQTVRAGQLGGGIYVASATDANT
ncbi:MAG: class I SAM-dependent methyltransferase [Chthoniobacterales bacterium]